MACYLLYVELAVELEVEAEGGKLKPEEDPTQELWAFIPCPTIEIAIST